MRCFIAIPLSKEIQTTLDAHCAPLKTIESDVKWVEPHLMHLTLQFLGDLSRDQAERVANHLKIALCHIPAFAIECSAIGAFPAIENPRILWMGINKGSQSVATLYQIVHQAIEAAQIKIKNEPFHPHITLGRLRSGFGRKNFIEQLKKSPPLAQTQDVKQVILYESVLSHEGPIHTPRWWFNLAN